MHAQDILALPFRYEFSKKAEELDWNPMEVKEIASKLEQLSADVTAVRVDIGKLATRDDEHTRGILRMAWLEDRVNQLENRYTNLLAQQGIHAREVSRLDQIELDTRSLSHKMSWAMGALAVVILGLNLLRWVFP